MDLLSPGTGLIVWQFIIFVGLFFLLKAFAWKPILASLKEREESIQQALDSAEKAKIEMASLKSDNEKLLKEAREERDRMLKDAKDAANRLHDEAQVAARKNADRIIEDAKAVIHTEKQAALRDVKAQVAMFSLAISEKLIKKNLSEDKQQKELVDTFIKDLKLN
ncbi:MAG: F0F1 ATP synthase subunit B [Cytophagales bacterium]|jgi:F-type H+-transporting ATPase subunit b|nr:F0F1 ATP synthase subunit B [Cytophagales bacterium]MCA6386290.1 F0F1 ATP synthase subunit B [Cytophagales bacterium]MCA6391487.1 F0F1 ATP synthase subunit B [Cytophagales bacterium]MCA6394667.1 F0F1 ATP synthase subunit B [Cytophagales bacterium]MCA6399155.1 F0F1 ATP synthase subunit B [Cytophagales bacterium]